MKLFRISMLRFATAMIAVSLIAVIGMPSYSNARDLTVVSWGGAYQEAQRKAYFEPFMKKTGKKVLDESYNGEMAKIRAMVEANNVTWDVVQVESPELINACEQGLLEIIDWSRNHRVGPRDRLRRRPHQRRRSKKLGGFLERQEMAGQTRFA